MATFININELAPPSAPAPIDPALVEVWQHVVDASPTLTWLNDPGHTWIILVILLIEFALHAYVVISIGLRVVWFVGDAVDWIIYRWRVWRVEDRPGA